MRLSAQNCVNPKLYRESILENASEANLKSRTNVLNLRKSHFSDIYKFLSDEVETIEKVIPGKVRKSVKNCLNPKLVIESFLKIGFEDTLRSKANVLNL